MTNRAALLTVEEMYEADRMTIQGGTSGFELMESAGRLCFQAIIERHDPCSVVVLCGPGNNGGDGFVIARLLQQEGWVVRVALLGELSSLKGDAALAAQAWSDVCDLRSLTPISTDSVIGSELVVDAVFGAGLARDVDGVMGKVISQVNQSDIPVISIDVPSGVDGNDGTVRGLSFVAETTITFFRKKLGHLLMPGRGVCGEVLVCDIGIPDTVLGEIEPSHFENVIGLWGSQFPKLEPQSHKYDRGHTLVVSGGPWSTGAARLAARAALRVGSGLVTVASPSEALPINAAHLTAIMLTPCDDAADLSSLLSDDRKNVVAIGPGCGVGSGTKDLVRAALSSGRPVVIDADGLTSWEKNPTQLFAITRENTILTPHPGEFRRLFPDIVSTGQSRIEQATAAAKLSGAVVLLKGPDTVVAAPDGRAAVTNNAPRWLATAGSGDVLCGCIAGLMAQGMPAFEAVCAGAWIHGQAGDACGPGLIAEDLPEVFPGVLSDVLMMLAFEN